LIQISWIFAVFPPWESAENKNHAAAATMDKGRTILPATEAAAHMVMPD